MKYLLVALTLLICASPLLATQAYAEQELLELFPKQRASHMESMNNEAQGYAHSGQIFIDNLYSSHAEGNMASASTADKPKIPEADLDAYINGTQTLTDKASAQKAPTSAPPLPTSAK
jgi:hypothetical protein